MAAAVVAAANSNDSNASVGQRRGSIGDVDSNAAVTAVMPAALAAAANSNGSNGSSGQRRGSIDAVDSNGGGFGYGGGGGGIK